MADYSGRRKFMATTQSTTKWLTTALYRHLLTTYAVVAILTVVFSRVDNNNNIDSNRRTAAKTMMSFADAQATFCFNDELEAFGHCYLIINHKMTWMESEIYCQSRGANLVRIDGIDENQWLAKVIPGDAWIGLQRLGNNSQSPYGWTPTLDKPLFDNYAPNLRYEDHRCMELETNGTWDDDACWMMQFAICERNPNAPVAIYPRLDRLEKFMNEIKPGSASYVAASKGETWGLLASLESRLFSTTIIFSILLVLVIAVMLVVFLKLRRIAPYSSSWGTVTASSLDRRTVASGGGGTVGGSPESGSEPGGRPTITWIH